MNKALWKKCFTESALLFIAIALGVAAFAWFRVHVVGEVDTSSFQRILDLLPEKWLRFTTVDVDWLISYDGRTALTLDEPFLIMLIAIWAIVRGSDVVSGEISRGTMEMMLAQPVSRKQTFVIHAAVTLLGVLILVLITWIFMWVAILMTDVKVEVEGSNVWETLMGPVGLLLPAKEVEFTHQPMRDYVSPGIYWPGLVNLFLLGCFIAGMATLFSAFDRFRWRTLGCVVAFYMVASMIKILALSSDTFQWTGWLTFFSLYEPELSIKLYQADPSAFWQLSMYNDDGTWKGFGQFGHNLCLLLMTIACYVIGYRVFRKRDIPAPL